MSNLRFPKFKMPRRLLLSVVLGLILIGLILGWANKNHHSGLGSFGGGSSKHNNGSAPNSATDFNKSRYSINDPASLWVVVNKGRGLPSDYVPANLVVPHVPLRLSAGSSEMLVRQDMATALQMMINEAAAQGQHLMLASGYRSYASQASLYNSYVASQGRAQADASSAHPGHSEHQTGLAADLEPSSRSCEVELCFESTPEGQWLAANLSKYGFTIRYQKAKELVTGYQYEPWHVRYLGVGLATELYKAHQTMEDFFGLSFYTTYPSQPYQLKPGN